MGPRPWKPDVELEGALERGDLRYALTLADELRLDGKPIGLDVAAKLLSLVAAREPERFDRYATRWLARWLRETPTPTIEQAAEIAGALADGLSEPQALASILEAA